MPTYDYRCKACGHTFELFQSMSDGEKRKCPKCAKNSLERLIGAGAGLIFKGSGYYLTDYRSKSYEEGAKADRDAAKAGDSAAGSDSKAASSKDSESKSSDSKPDKAASDKAASPKAASSKADAPKASKPKSPRKSKE